MYRLRTLYRCTVMLFGALCLGTWLFFAVQNVVFAKVGTILLAALRLFF